MWFLIARCVNYQLYEIFIAIQNASNVEDYTKTQINKGSILLFIIPRLRAAFKI